MSLVISKQAPFLTLTASALGSYHTGYRGSPKDKMSGDKQGLRGSWAEQPQQLSSPREKPGQAAWCRHLTLHLAASH